MLNIIRMCVVSACLLCLLVFSAPVRAEEGCKEVLQNKCTTCHFVKYICPKLEEGRSSTYWKWVMYTMKKEGAKLSDKEGSQLVDCLSANDAQAQSFCTPKK